MPEPNFGWAIANMWDGKKLSRKHWNGPDQFLQIQRPDSGSKMSLPYIYITTVQADRVPWLASQSDMLSADWFIVE